MPVFALIDGASVNRVGPQPAESGTEHWWVDEEQGLGLVPWKKDGTVALASDVDPAELVTHLRGLLKVRTESGDRLLFRYYDPRVLRVFLPTCSSEQLDEFFGPVSAFYVPAEEPGTMLIFRNGPGALVTEKRTMQSEAARPAET